MNTVVTSHMPSHNTSVILGILSGGVFIYIWTLKMQRATSVFECIQLRRGTRACMPARVWDDTGHALSSLQIAMQAAILASAS
jgi:hypothetical protein